MRYSKVIALSSVSAALAVVLLLLGTFIPVLDISCVMLAGFVFMLPLSKKMYLGAFLSYLASVLLGFLITGSRLQVIIPFAVFFGLHPIINALCDKWKLNKILAYFIKAAWFVGSCFVIYYFTKMFVVENATVEKYINYIIGFGCPILFIIYDMFVKRMQIAVNYLVARLKL